MPDLLLPQSATEFGLKDRLARSYDGPQFGHGGGVDGLAHGIKRGDDLTLGIQFVLAVAAADARVPLNRVVHHQVLAEVESSLRQ